MKRLVCRVILGAFLAMPSLVMAEEATHNGGATGGRAVDAGAGKTSLLDYVSACLAGRAFPAGSTGGIADTSTLPTSALFQSKCLNCHTAQGKPDPRVMGNPVEAITSGRMPKGSTLTEAEKAELLGFFRTQGF